MNAGTSEAAGLEDISDERVAEFFNHAPAPGATDTPGLEGPPVAAGLDATSRLAWKTNYISIVPPTRRGWPEEQVEVIRRRRLAVRAGLFQAPVPQSLWDSSRSPEAVQRPHPPDSLIARPRLVGQTVQPLGEEAPPPRADRVCGHPKLTGDRDNRRHLRPRTRQHDPRPQSQSLGRCRPTRPASHGNLPTG